MRAVARSWEIPNAQPRARRLCLMPEAGQQQHGSLRRQEEAVGEAQVKYKYPTVESARARAHDQPHSRCPPELSSRGSTWTLV